MIKRFYSILFVAVFCLNSFAFAQSASKSDNSKITKTEAQEAQDLARNFTARFLATKSLAPLLDEFYFSDFIDRYKKYQSLENSKAVNNLFVPGLTYYYEAIGELSSEQWRRFYIAAHDFVLLGFVAALKNAKDNPTKEDDFDVVKFYSPSVVALLDKNPNLANVIQKQGDYKSIGSAEELRSATTTLEQALKIIREKQSSSPLLEINDKQLAKIFKKDYFKPQLQVVDEEYFGFPANTRFILVKTPIGMQLMLSKDKDKLKIVYATLSLD